MEHLYLVIPVGLLVLVCPPDSCTCGGEVLEEFEAFDVVVCRLGCLVQCGCDISVQLHCKFASHLPLQPAVIPFFSL